VIRVAPYIGRSAV